MLGLSCRRASLPHLTSLHCNSIFFSQSQEITNYSNWHDQSDRTYPRFRPTWEQIFTVCHNCFGAIISELMSPSAVFECENEVWRWDVSRRSWAHVSHSLQASLNLLIWWTKINCPKPMWVMVISPPTAPASVLNCCGELTPDEDHKILKWWWGKKEKKKSL